MFDPIAFSSRPKAVVADLCVWAQDAAQGLAMKRALAIVTLMLLLGIRLEGGARDGAWQRVEEATQKGLPQTALQELEPIIRGAQADRAWAEAVKAIARKVVLEGTVQGNQPEERIRRLQAQLAQAPKETVPMLDTVLAHWYWHYFQRNRWRFLRRTGTTQAPSQDFTAWDLPRLYAEIDRQFTKALAADLLRATPVGAWDELLEKGTLPDEYRPTLYDFVAHEALAFYTSGEQAAARPEDAFELAADSPIFDSSDKFLAWKPGGTRLPSGSAGTPPDGGPESPLLKAIRLYQDLLRFHRAAPNPTARLAVDLERLVWGNNVAFGETKSARFKAALKTFADAQGDHDLASMALYHWAKAVQGEGDLLLAHELARRGQQAHPQSPGGMSCANLVAEIEARSASIATERLWSQPWPTIDLHYRNVTNVWLRLVAWNWDEFLERRHHRPEALDDQERAAVLARSPARAWSETLPPTTDYRQRTAKLDVPRDVKPGFYFLVASHKPDFSVGNNQLALTDVWVSDLTFVVRPRSGALDGFVLLAESGEPVAGAQVEGWTLDAQGNRLPVSPAETDTNGFFTLKATPRRGHLLKATWRGQQVASSTEYAHWPDRPEVESSERTVFFTDRALYRPGQTVQYKGICLRINQQQDSYVTLAGANLTVAFYDPNGKETARREHRANDYGAFSGSFAAPRGGLLGQMRLAVVTGPRGTAWLSVEEYKRPKFQVTLDAPKPAPKLNERVKLTGHALAYTGAAVDGAAVKYRVVREVRMPWWWGWRGRGGGGWHHSPSQEIAHGSLRTGADGRFETEFVAKPDLRVPEKDEPTFTFSVHADVTDSAGETRSAERAVRLGYTALEAALEADPWQTDRRPVEVRLHTTTFEGEPQTAEGIVRVHTLKSPAVVQRPPLTDGFADDPDETGATASPDLSDANHWPEDRAVFERGFTTDRDGKASFSVTLSSGAYRVTLETRDRFGKKVTSRLPLTVVRPGDTKFPIAVPRFLGAPQWTLEPGQEFVALWGTGYGTGRAFVEIEHRNRTLQRFWTRPGITQAEVRQAVTEALRGGFTLHVTFVRENRAYLDSHKVEVPWSNKELTVKWEHFTAKLEPGQKETWTAVVAGPKSKADSPAGPERAAAEMVATLYDASLDQFRALSWPAGFGVFREDTSQLQRFFGNEARGLQPFHQDWTVPRQPVEVRYRSFPRELTMNLWGYRMNALRFFETSAVARTRGAEEPENLLAEATPDAAPMALTATPSVQPALAPPDRASAGQAFAVDAAHKAAGAAAAPPAKAPDLGRVAARRNLSETAFFFPQLLTDTNGVVRLTFAMPEALTEWRFLGFAHDRDLRAGLLTGKAVTAKDLMVQPNPPRFLREGDVLEFTVKVSNQSDRRQQGSVRLTFTDAWTDKSADASLDNQRADQRFDLPAKESRSFAWPLRVPDGLATLAYKAVAATDTLSDGEEGLLPVLARRILVTESLPLPIRGPATRQFKFERLAAAAQSTTLRHQSLTVQMVSHPAWYAVMALPYLMEFPHECSEQTFNRLYANALARFLAHSNPRFRRVFDLWKNTPALDSPLQKNPELKSVALEESPWLRQAQDENQARRNVGALFDANRLDTELPAALRKLGEAQLPEGAWPWFPGGPANDYITLYITTGFGRLRHLGVDLDVSPAVRALQRLDAWLDRTYRDIQRAKTPEKNHLTPTLALYLYGRSFFLKDRPIAPAHKEALDYFLGQAKQHWLQLGERQSHGHLALGLQRFGDVPTARAIMKSLKERSVTDAELGRFWRDTELSWWWYRAPIETQALMIEAFAEVAQEPAVVEECKVWLLKQKQTQDWKTTKATADAVYALLLQGRELLADDTPVEVTVGGVKVRPPTSASPNSPAQIRNPKSEIGNAAVEPGTGFYERRFAGPEVKPSLAAITVKKTTPGVAWGSAHWQYFEDQSKVTPYAGTPLKLKKTLYTRVNTARGPVLEPVKSAVAVGDELVVRVEVRVDRDVEYVHLKDQRGSGTEPVNVLSGYRFRDGLAYYESTRDTASHFFIDYLPKGTYVIEYSTHVQHRGEYQTGIATLQCMYAPEFNSHSESLRLRVK
jgi:uncharacterized protein YfaS (alpha-2-macroglobulin family)